VSLDVRKDLVAWENPTPAGLYKNITVAFLFQA